MDISQLVMYGIEDNTHELLRYDFGSDSMRSLGPIRLSDGTTLHEIESLAHGAGQVNLYGIWNFEADSRSRLMDDERSGSAIHWARARDTTA